MTQKTGNFPGKWVKSPFFWTASNVKTEKMGKISNKMGKIFVLRIILSDRKISVKNSAFFILTHLSVLWDEIHQVLKQYSFLTGILQMKNA